MPWSPPLKRLKNGKAVLPGAYLLVFRCRSCGEEFHKAKQRGAVMHGVMQMTWREVLLVHTLHVSLRTATHMHDDGRHTIADLMALKPYKGPTIYIEEVL